ncbi:MAG: FAD-dependent oxidoreductase [Acidobacteria bacterium]|nr:FAD-dependent oxidoreductase [Acidobacteriota bacterium]
MLVSLLAATIFTVLDVERVPINGDPLSAVLRLEAPAQPRSLACDVLIAGAGMGGVSGALRAADRGRSVCLTEESSWVGGQATAGGVSALDEHKFIEITGAPLTYLQFRQKLRGAYGGIANPGACYVSSLCFEPKVAVKILDEMLASRSNITVLRRTKIVELTRVGNRLTSALAVNLDSKQFVRITPGYVLDATETGDMLPLAGVAYTLGAESRTQTGEPHAPEKPNPACVQSFTYPFIIESRPGENHSLPKLPDHEAIVKRQNFSLRMNYPSEYGWKGEVLYSMYGDDLPMPNNMSPRPFFSWRRVKNPNIALMNWPRQDYHEESILDRSPADQARILQQAKRTSYAFLAWLHYDLGHPEMKLLPEQMGTADGLSMVPYIRESRRMVARETVREQDIVAEFQPGVRARHFPASVGTGFYMVDIHPCGANEKGRMMMPRPFQIPLGALQPKDPIENFLPAGKNIGVTHLANGAYRLHPIEWNIGESAAILATLGPNQTLDRELAAAGIPLFWFDDLAPSHPRFPAIQLTAQRGLYPASPLDLHASPDSPVSRGEAAQILATLFALPAERPAAITMAVEQGWMAVDHRNWFHADLPLLWTDWRTKTFPRQLPALPAKIGPVTRGELAQYLANAIP